MRSASVRVKAGGGEEERRGMGGKAAASATGSCGRVEGVQAATVGQGREEESPRPAIDWIQLHNQMGG